MIASIAWLLVGLVLGGTIGCVIMAVLTAAGNADAVNELAAQHKATRERMQENRTNRVWSNVPPYPDEDEHATHLGAA
jgi:hypothetical protein